MCTSLRIQAFLYVHPLHPHSRSPRLRTTSPSQPSSFLMPPPPSSHPQTHLAPTRELESRYRHTLSLLTHGLRMLLALLLASLFVAPTIGAAPPPVASCAAIKPSTCFRNVGYDKVPATSASACCELCTADGQKPCVAWTYVAGDAKPCHLKATAPNASQIVHCNGSSSLVRPPAPTPLPPPPPKGTKVRRREVKRGTQRLAEAQRGTPAEPPERTQR